ncbi:DNA cytosine methyltransferase, partial [Phocaeicola dorei]
MKSLKEILRSLEGLSDIELFVIDLFCGAGGLSEGVEEARLDGNRCAKVVCCVNHDKNAILSHDANIPDALHFIEDIRTLELSPISTIVERIRQLYPDAMIMLHASLECTNFSKAKGGQPRDADSRTLAEHLFRYIDVIDPDYIQIENVEEFMSWGDMDEKGKPISMDKGRLYQKWVRNVKKYGYNFEHRILNAADFGAYTTRKRFFGIFAKKSLPIVFPEPTHCKGGRQDMFSKLEKWKPVKEVLDFSDEGTTIFREKPLAEKTLERIYAGLIKFVAGGKDAFLSRYNTVRPQDTCKSVDEPCGVLTTENRFAKVQVSFLSKQFSGHPESKNVSVEEPAGAITCKDHHVFVSAYYGNGHNHSVDLPAPTVTTKDRMALIESRFMCSYNFKDTGKDINQPCPTLLTKDRLSLVSPFFMNQYSGGGQVSDINSPCPAVTTTPKQNLVTCQPWIMNTAFSNVGSSIEEPSQTITANRKWHYLMNPQFNSAGGSVDSPCFTLIARMDKMPPYLVATESGQVAIEIYDNDSPMTVKIKEFMALYGIVDIKMR